MAKRLGNAVGLIGFASALVGSAWAGPPQDREGPVPLKPIVVFDKKTRSEWPDGQTRTFRAHFHIDVPKPSRYPSEPEPVPIVVDPFVTNPDVKAKKPKIVPSAAAVEAAALAYQAFKSGDHARAKAGYSEAIRIEPKQPAHYSNRAATCLWLSETNQAIADLTRAIELSPENPARYYVDRALVWYFSKQPEKAFADLYEGIRLKPKAADGYMIRGIFRAGKGDLDGALADLNESIRLEPGDKDGYLARFFIHVLRHDSRSALAGLEDALEHNPDSQETVQYFQMMFLQIIGDLDAALAIADRLAVRGLCDSSRARTLNSPTQAERDKAKGESGKTYFGNAEEDFGSRDRATIDCARVIVWRALIHQDKKEWDKVKEDCDLALFLDANNTLARIFRASIWCRKHEYSKALADIDTILAVQPEEEKALSFRAWLLGTCPDPKIRDGRAALEAARRLCSISNDSKNLDTLAAAHAECGDFEAAIRTEQEAIAKFDNPKAKDVEEYRERLALYQAKRPYRDNGPE